MSLEVNMKTKLSLIWIASLMFSTFILASEKTINLGKSFFPKKDIVIDTDSPEEITVKYHLMYYISDGCATDVVTMYKVGGCLRKKYKTLNEESKYILNLKDSSARKGKGAQVIRLSVKQEEKNSYDVIPVVEVLDGNEDAISIKDSWFSSTKVKLTARDEVINSGKRSEKKSPNQSNTKDSKSKSSSGFSQ